MWLLCYEFSFFKRLYARTSFSTAPPIRMIGVTNATMYHCLSGMAKIANLSMLRPCRIASKVSIFFDWFFRLKNDVTGFIDRDARKHQILQLSK